MRIFKNMTIANKGLRYKLMVAFSLMSIVPLLACTYIIVSHIFPQLDTVFDDTSVIFLSILIAILGLILAKGLVDPVINMALEARIIASGDYDRNIAVKSDDEVGTLGESINSMTQKIKSNIDELKNYGHKMREINSEIHKKVLALSSLLQIGDIISSGSMKVDAVLELVVEKVPLVFDTGFAVLYMAKEEGGDLLIRTQCNIDKEVLPELVIKRGGHSLLERVMEDQSLLIIDKSTKQSKEIDKFKTSNNIKNVIAIPITSGRRKLGLLIVGNRLDDFRFMADDIDLVKVFCKQMTIAIEADMLNKKTEELAIKDDLTELYNKAYTLARLEEEIKRAIFYQRPCSFIVFNIDGFKNFRDHYGELAAEEALKRVAKIIKDNMAPIGKAARLSGDEFAMLLPEKNKKEAINIADDIRKKIESANLLREGNASLTVSGGVSENPIDGTSADELLKKAADAVKQAKSSGKNKIAS